MDYNLHFLIYDGDTVELKYIEFTDKKTLIYCSRIEDCKTVAQELGCKYLSGEMSLKEKQAVLKDFEEN